MDAHLGLLEHLWEHETGRPRLRHRPAALPPPVSLDDRVRRTGGTRRKS
jgi:hypothetical protein